MGTRTCPVVPFASTAGFPSGACAVTSGEGVVAVSEATPLDGSDAGPGAAMGVLVIALTAREDRLAGSWRTPSVTGELVTCRRESKRADASRPIRTRRSSHRGRHHALRTLIRRGVEPIARYRPI